MEPTTTEKLCQCCHSVSRTERQPRRPDGLCPIFPAAWIRCANADARAHGRSGGAIASYAIRESNDLHRWLDWLVVNERPACISGFAESMGAAGLLQPLQSGSRFCAVAAELPFSTFREIAYDRVGQFFHTGPWLGRIIFRPIVECAFTYSNWRYHLNFDLESPEKVVERRRFC